MTLKAVLFDIDGTLVDSNEAHVDAWAFAFREAGRPREIDAIRKQIDKGGDLLVPALLPGEPADMCEQIAEAHGRIFASAYLDHVRSFPNASALVERSATAGLKVVLSSSAKEEELSHYVDLLDVSRFLSATISSDDVESSKPAPDIFSTALAKIDLSAEDVIAVGDTPDDIEAGCGAGSLLSGSCPARFRKPSYGMQAQSPSIAMSHICSPTLNARLVAEQTDDARDRLTYYVPVHDRI
jgi:beta-phosphoglucomutase-like phosphatase (HAD superfamily)